jgi:hypothetical protein
MIQIRIGSAAFLARLLSMVRDLGTLIPLPIERIALPPRQRASKGYFRCARWFHIRH